MGWDIFFGVLAVVLVVMVIRSVAERLASGSLAPKDLSDWRDYAWMTAVLLIALSWTARTLLGLDSVGAVSSAAAIAALGVYLALWFKTRSDRRSS